MVRKRPGRIVGKRDRVPVVLVIGHSTLCSRQTRVKIRLKWHRQAGQSFSPWFDATRPGPCRKAAPRDRLAPRAWDLMQCRGRDWEAARWSWLLCQREYLFVLGGGG